MPNLDPKLAPHLHSGPDPSPGCYCSQPATPAHGGSLIDLGEGRCLPQGRPYRGYDTSPRRAWSRLLSCPSLRIHVYPRDRSLGHACFSAVRAFVVRSFLDFCHLGTVIRFCPEYAVCREVSNAQNGPHSDQERVEGSNSATTIHGQGCVAVATQHAVNGRRLWSSQRPPSAQTARHQAVGTRRTKSLVSVLS